MERNLFTLAKMKKEKDLLYHDNGTNKIFYDLSGQEKTWFTPEIMETIKPQIIKNNAFSCIESSAYGLKAINRNDGTQLYIDIDFRITHVYSKKSGRRLYTYKKVCGFRINAYKFNLYGVISNGEKPCYSIGYGTLDIGKTLYLHHTTPDIEI